MMKPITAPKFSTKYLYAELGKAQDDFAKVALKEFKKTVANWSSPAVTFDVSKTDAKSTGVWALGISTKDKRWIWTSGGTRPHIIRAKNYPVLVFKPGSTPKTKPGSITSGKGKPGTGIRTPKVVHHPGTKPRLFGVQISKALQPRFNRMYRAAWLKGTEEDRMWEGR